MYIYPYTVVYINGSILFLFSSLLSLSILEHTLMDCQMWFTHFLDQCYSAWITLAKKTQQQI